MNALPCLTIDTSVWISAAEDADVYHAQSVAFVAEVIRQQGAITLPAFARVGLLVP